jgi:hypothetical protein
MRREMRKQGELDVVDKELAGGARSVKGRQQTLAEIPHDADNVVARPSIQ